MIKIVITALTGVFLSLTLKRTNPEFSIVLSILTGVTVIGFLIGDIKNLIDTVNIFNSSYGISYENIKLLLKILGISYITQFASSLCEDCGEKYIAQKIEFAGRVFIMSFSLPILIELLNTIIGLI